MGVVDEDSPRYKVAKSLAEDTGLTMKEVSSVLGGLPKGEPREQNIWDIVQNLLLMLVTDNLFKAAMEMELLPLIVFSIVFAGVLTTMGKQVGGLKDFVEQSNQALMKVILLLMRLAPLGIFCLVAARFGEAEHKGEFLEQLQQIGRFVATVLVGLGLHFFITLPLILWFITKRNPYRFMLQMSQALLTAFSTASSFGHLADYDGVCDRPRQGFARIDRVRASARRDDQHGRHRALRSRPPCSSLRKPSVRISVLGSR